MVIGGGLAAGARDVRRGIRRELHRPTRLDGAGRHAELERGGRQRASRVRRFPRDERGLALGLRQTAVPAGAALASFTLPARVVRRRGCSAVRARGAMFVAAVAAAVWLRDGPRTESAAPPAPDAVRDPRIWRLSAASSLMIIGQVGITSLLVLYLYSERGWTPEHAALALGGVQVLRWHGSRPGRWSDVLGERIEPFRLTSWPASCCLRAWSSSRPRSWRRCRRDELERLSFTAAAEISGRQQAARRWESRTRRCAWWRPGVPVGLGASAISWSLVFAVMGVAPLIARALLGPLVEDERRRRREREARLESRRHAGGTTSVDPVGP